MKAHELKPAAGSRHARKRVGRGISSGQGKTSGRGTKGQGSRSSSGLPVNFEGGQMPLSQRLPKMRGFSNFTRKEFAVVNLGKLNRFEAGTEVGPALLMETGLVRKPLDGVKILAAGELTVALKVTAHKVSSAARAAIEKAGGSVTVLIPEGESKPPKHRGKDLASANKGGGAKGDSKTPAGAVAETSTPKASAGAKPEGVDEPLKDENTDPDEPVTAAEEPAVDQLNDEASPEEADSPSAE